MLGQGRLVDLAGDGVVPKHTGLAYNDDGQIDTIAIAEVYQTFRYSGLHPPTAMKFSDTSLEDAFGYRLTLEEKTGRVKSFLYGDRDTLRAYTYDAMGQVLEVSESEAIAASVCIDYDPDYGWICSGHEVDWNVLTADTLAYDAVGNREDSGAMTASGTNRLTSFDGYSFTYDDEGRTLTKSKAGFFQTYHWNARSQLDSVTTVEQGAGTTVVRYTYDGLGRRITRDGPSGFEEYIYDGPNMVLILDGQANVKTELTYYPGVDRPHSLRQGQGLYYFVTDHTGSVAGLYEYDKYGSPERIVANRYRYDLWGAPQGTITEAVDNPLRFKGRPYDEDTGLYDFRARWYDPETGRFISQDPIGLAGGINLYRFVGNDPIGGWDPSGMSGEDVWLCSPWRLTDEFTVEYYEYEGGPLVSKEFQRYQRHCEHFDSDPGGRGEPIMTAGYGGAGKGRRGYVRSLLNEVGVDIDGPLVVQCRKRPPTSTAPRRLGFLGRLGTKRWVKVGLNVARTSMIVGTFFAEAFFPRSMGDGTLKPLSHDSRPPIERLFGKNSLEANAVAQAGSTFTAYLDDPDLCP